MFKSSEGKYNQWMVVPVFVVMLTLWSVEATAIIIKAEANWAGLPTPVIPTNAAQIDDPLINGDFTIQNGSGINLGERGYIIGDGINEHSDWTFDFSSDPAWSSFDLTAPLRSAELTLTLIPRGLPDPNNPNDPNAQLDDFCTDGVFIHGISGSVRINPGGSPCPAFSFDVTAMVTVDLLDYQSGGVPVADISDRILQKLLSNNGELDMRYIADAIIEKTELVLVSIPEPGTLLLVSLGLAGLGFRKYQGK